MERLPPALWHQRAVAVRRYSLADAMYAPVALRFRSYGALLSPAAQGYLDAVLQDPPLRQWLADAALEPWTISYSEVGLPAG